MSSYASLDALCESVLRVNKNVQSVSVLSKMGRLVGENSKPEFANRFHGSRNEHLFMQSVLQISMGRDFDDVYGPINYYVSERANLTLLTFPLDDNVLLVTCSKNLSPITIAKKIRSAIDDYRKQASVIEL